jgi:tetratricopeptide (TPR) repeat protein
MWHPLTTLSHILDCQFFGLNPLGHHSVSVLIHIANTLLLFLIIRNITGTTWASVFVAAVFALHPLQVESVAWAAEKKTVLSGLFWLLTMAAYIHYSKQPRLSRYLLVLLVFGLCIMTKPVVVTLPFVLLLLDYWPLDRVRWAHQSKNTKPAKSNQKSIGWLIAEKIPLLAMSAFLSVMTYISQETGGVVRTLAKMPLDYRIDNMFLSYIRYIGKLIWPSSLAVFYPPLHLNLLNTTALICAFIFILISATSIYIGRRKKYIAVGWLWFAGTLVPMIGLVQVGAQSMANRYMYIPMIGLLLIVGWDVKDYINKQPRARIAAIILGVAALFSLLVLTRMQVRHWQNSMTLNEYTLKVTQNNALAENNYGSALFEAGRLDEAISHLNKALSIIPKMAEAEDNLGRVCLKQKKVSEAITHFKRVLQKGPAPAKTYANLGSAYIQVGQFDLAIENLNKAIELKPDNIDVLNKLAWLFAAVDNTSIHNTQKAVEFAQRGCELTGYKDPMLLDTLAVAYAAADRFDEAKATAEKALNIAKSSGKEDLAGKIQKRIKLYEAGQPYREQ